MASYECRYLEDIERHIDAYIGKRQDGVLHEILSLTVHVDIHVVRPSEKVPFLTLVTSGMSDLPMKPPKGLKNPADFELAEIIAFLPPEWPIGVFVGDDEDREQSSPYWYPAAWMKHYARMPHEYDTMLTWYQTTQNGDPASPIEEGLGMAGFLFAPPLQLDARGHCVSTHDGRSIRLLNMVPIWPDEIVFAMNKGGEALCEKLGSSDNLSFNPSRPSCIRRKTFLGLF